MKGKLDRHTLISGDDARGKRLVQTVADAALDCGGARAYYNECEPYAVEWLRNLIAAGLIAPGDVDSRKIEEVRPEDLTGYTQVHLFAGIAGWSCALRLAGWEDSRPIWTGSCPCQPFSAAGQGKGFADRRHLWPHFYRLIRGCRPALVMGEQVAGKAGYAWFDRVAANLAKEDYESRAVDIPACSVNAPHIRNRLYWVAYTESIGSGTELRQAHAIGDGHGAPANRGGVGRIPNANQPRSPLSEQRGVSTAAQCELETRPAASERRGGSVERVGNATSHDQRRNSMPGAYRQGKQVGRSGGDACGLVNPARVRGQAQQRSQPHGPVPPDARGMAYAASGQIQEQKRRADNGDGIGSTGAGYWDDWNIVGPDPKGKYRRLGPGLRLVASGVPCRVGKLRALGNAIVPEVAAEVIRAWVDVFPPRASIALSDDDLSFQRSANMNSNRNNPEKGSNLSAPLSGSDVLRPAGQPSRQERAGQREEGVGAKGASA